MLRFHWIRFWIGFVAALQVLGWALSGLGQLGSAGYAIGLPPALLISFLLAGYRTAGPGTAPADPDPTRPRRFFWQHPRLRWWLPRIFLVLAVGSLVTGLVYAPNNGDALGYRTPRVLNWLQAGHWHWIDTVDARQNTRTVAYEWATAPLLALTASDRLLPLLSVASFLLLPGSLFGLWRAMGIRGRVAWGWMWLLPTAYGLALQAGGVLNDLFGTVFSVAAVQLALEARVRKDHAAARYSVVAAALMVGSKASSLPLLLPWAIALWPSIPLLLGRQGLMALTALVAVVSSNIPTAVLNWQHCRDWTGLTAETRARGMIGNGSAWAYLQHNTGLLLSQNLNPPVLPAAERVNRWVEYRLSADWKDWLAHGAEDGVRAYKLRELVHEDFAGLGLPLTLLLAGLTVFQFRRSGHANGVAVAQQTPGTPAGWRTALLVSPWFALLFYASQSGITSAARLILPYYPLLLTSLLGARGLDRWMRSRTWACIAGGAALSTVFVCAVSPMRPWFPVRPLLQREDARELIPGTVVDRFSHAYTVCQERATGFDRFLKVIPGDDRRIGMLAQFQFLETPLWRPFGHHQVIRPPAPATPQAFRERGIRHVVMRVEDIPLLSGMDLPTWLQEGSGEVLYRGVFCHFPVETGTEWVVVQLGSARP